MNIAIYVRKSVTGDDKSISLNSQEQECRNYFKNKGNKFTVYVDNGFTGKNTNRPDFKRLTEDVSKNKFDVVVCYKFDRIARNTLDFLTTLELFKAYGADLISITEGYDPSTPQGKMMVTLLASLAEMERENIRQRVMDSMHNLACQGRWSGGTTPFGYEVEKTKQGSYLKLKDPDKIEYIFKSFLNGKSHNDIAREIGKTSKGVKSIIRNPLYMKSSELGNEFLKTLGYNVLSHGSLGAGYITYGKKSNSKTSSSKLAVVSTHQSVIDASDWVAAFERLKTFDGHARPRISSRTWLAQLVVCKFCGSHMIMKQVANQSINSTYYLKPSCSCFKKYINVTKTQNEILNKLRALTLNSNSYSDVEGFNPIKSEIALLKDQIANKEKIMFGLIDKLALCSDVAAKRIILSIEQLEADIGVLTKDKNQKLLILEGKPKLKQTFNNKHDLSIFLDDFENMDMKSKQLAIRNVINYIEFDGVKPVIY